MVKALSSEVVVVPVDVTMMMVTVEVEGVTRTMVMEIAEEVGGVGSGGVTRTMVKMVVVLESEMEMKSLQVMVEGVAEEMIIRRREEHISGILFVCNSPNVSLWTSL